MPLDLNNHEHIQHMLSNYLAEKNPDMGNFDKEDFHTLLNDTLEGVNSAEYLSGHKKKEVETFYDAHPIQATIHDTLNKAPMLAAGAVGAQTGGSILKDFLLNRKINKAVGSTGQKDGMKPLSGEDYEKSPDLQRTFPKATALEPTKDGPKLKFQPHHDPGVYGDTYHKLNTAKPSLQKPNSTGYLSQLLETSKRKDERLTRMMSEHFPKDTLEQGEHGNAEHFGNIAKELGGVNPSRAAGIGEHTAKRIADPNMKVKNLLSHVNPRLAMGAGAVGLGGLALAPMVSYLQKKVYGDDHVKTWMNNRRMTEGKFE